MLTETYYSVRAYVAESHSSLACDTETLTLCCSWAEILAINKLHLVNFTIFNVSESLLIRSQNYSFESYNNSLRLNVLLRLMTTPVT